MRKPDHQSTKVIAVPKTGKDCKHCKLHLTPESFSKDKSTKTGLSRDCRDCQSLYNNSRGPKVTYADYELKRAVYTTVIIKGKKYHKREIV